MDYACETLKTKLLLHLNVTLLTRALSEEAGEMHSSFFSSVIHSVLQVQWICGTGCVAELRGRAYVAEYCWRIMHMWA